jgi:peptidyl-prolyl cis-trans isomerase B (cyclophilin B)
MKRTSLLSLMLVSTLVFSACAQQPEAAIPQETPPPQELELAATQSATPIATPVSTPQTKGKAMAETKQIASLETSKGTIEVELYPNKAPGTVKNFTTKATSGYYKNMTFHRVEDWVIQGGDPLGNGTGGDKMPTELSDEAFVEGSLGVARGGDIKVSNDSQFFICTTDCGWLTGQYTNFGKVTKGMDVAKKIAVGDKIISITVK